MKNGLIISGIVASVVIIVCAISYIGAHNKGNAFEQQIDAKYEDLEQVYSNLGQKIVDATDIASMQKNDVIAILEATMSARYGQDGAQNMLMIQEAMPNLNNTAYTKIMQIMEAGRNDFQFAQSQLNDQKRAYRTALGSFVGGTFLDMAGYPKINIGYPTGTQDDYPTISSNSAKQVFQTGVEDDCGMVAKAQNGGVCPE